jgi:hexulose-6-phosphate isomerase
MPTLHLEENLMMTSESSEGQNQTSLLLNRRAALRSTLAAVAATAGAPAATLAHPGSAGSDALRASPKLYSMKKSINLWAFPYPQRMSLR